MNEEHAVLIRGLLDFLNSVEAAIAEFKQQIAGLVEAAPQRQIVAEKPVNPNDTAILWLMKRLGEVKAKHPALTYNFLKDADGNITGLAYSAPNDECAQDVEKPTRWAFEKAAARAIVKNGA